MKVVKPIEQERLKRNEQKWSKALMDAGWTVIPSVILDRQKGLGLDPVDINILLQLAKHWWFSDNPPHPSKAAIADCMNVDTRTVQRHIAKMEEAGFIKRVPRYTRKNEGQDTNFYHFDGLIKEATPFANEAVEAKNARKADEVARRNRRRRPTMVSTPTRDDSK
jgi:hypothetical protein